MLKSRDVSDSVRFRKKFLPDPTHLCVIVIGRSNEMEFSFWTPVLFRLEIICPGFVLGSVGSFCSLLFTDVRLPAPNRTWNGFSEIKDAFTRKSDENRTRVERGTDRRTIPHHAEERHRTGIHGQVLEHKNFRHIYLRLLRHAAVRFGGQIRFRFRMAQLLPARCERCSA